MIVLIGCEFSGVVRRAFARRGHFAISVDLLPAEDGAGWGTNDYSLGWHYQGDLIDFLYNDCMGIRENGEFDLGIFHPECTYLCNSGVRWLFDPFMRKQQERWEKLDKAAEFYKKCREAPIKRKAVENPRMHKYAIERIGSKATQFIQPWQFGHGEIKATGLELINLPELKPTNIVDGRVARVHRAAPGPDRWKERSRTLEGIGEAMAEQWGNLND